MSSPFLTEVLETVLNVSHMTSNQIPIGLCKQGAKGNWYFRISDVFKL